jgi:hypothetical protein
MGFPPTIFAIMILGALALLVGVVIANVAVVQMAHYLNDKTRGAMKLRWWNSIGHGSSRVIEGYRQFAWKDQRPESRLRLGYRLIAAGLVTLFGASVVGQVLRGKG